MILASTSPRRKELLSELGFDFATVSPEVDETQMPKETGDALALRLAKSKALAGSQLAKEPNELVVAADTVVYFGNSIYGKPKDVHDAKRMLGELSGKTHTVSTGVAIAKNSRILTSFVESSRVTFHALTQAQIEAYVATNEPLDKAGSYGIQGKGRELVATFSGDITNIIGLPQEALVVALERIGLKLPARTHRS